MLNISEIMKTYTIKEILDNPKIIIFIENDKQFDKLSNIKELKLTNCYMGSYCYDPHIRRWSSSSTKTYPGSFSSDSIIITSEQIVEDVPEKEENKPKVEVSKWYSFNWDLFGPNSTIIAKIKEVNENSFTLSWRSYLWRKNDYSTSDGYDFRNVSNIKELSIDEVQKYLPENHPDKIESNQEFKVGDWVVLQYSSAKEIGYNTTSNNTRLKAGHIDKIANFRDGQTWSENSKIRWVGLESDPHNGVIEILLRHATQEEINNHLISIGQIPIGELLNTDIEPNKDNSYSCISVNRGENPQCTFNSIKLNSQEILKPKMILSIDDEELPMVNIIKINSIKQLLNNN